ncbi:MAG: SGNH/GDSL hydrolase family protein [Candidatus Pacebacteria bacterium]|jgi:hypothetical protein|nr:SGNH/GDSL hydrolase family protein [Candidatus Paceibacterota bacterium]MBT4004734.1 SGNH/GDSL hydrolase family protein [Candidatus Paceibacterota bacterium]MBT6899275.1 SGNH/GDSL hydrolase family protein [Candidatus Paceibacterota bacterium]MBT7184175.1 SGNH/GDSL hydrolase family protein [Candidatus Paceibacterota bacterium]MBT7309993.1 SGNH/GDSL hydrolase family protein [Candidatus Paceibacterota bacterium]
MKKILKFIKKNTKHFIINFLIFLASTLTSIVFLLMGINFLLSKIGYTVNNSLVFTLDTTKYSPEYIFWESYCTLMNDCSKDTPFLEKILARPANTYGENYSSCKRILFLGDSFSTALYSDLSYSDHFSKKLSKKSSQCITSLNIAAPGTGNSQQLAKLEDDIKKIKPDLIVWQFYWNDLNDNVQLAVHKVNNGQLKRKKAWRSSLFWAGFLNQNLPFMRESHLGKYIFSKATETDLFRYWPIDPQTEDEIKYNQMLIPLLLNSGKRIAANNSAALITTISPLECQFIDESSCDQWQIESNNALRNILTKNSNYIEMDQYLNYTQSINSSNSSSIKKINPDFLFAEEEAATPGYRHLSPSGEAYFGERLFNNFRDNYSQIL